MFDFKKFRKDQKLTQSELSEMLDRKQSFISAMETKAAPVPDGVVDDLRKHFGSMVDNYIIENDPNPVGISGNSGYGGISSLRVLAIISEYQARLDKKDEQLSECHARLANKDDQIKELTKVLMKEVVSIKQSIKKLDGSNLEALAEDAAGCADIG